MGKGAWAGAAGVAILMVAGAIAWLFFGGAPVDQAPQQVVVVEEKDEDPAGMGPGHLTVLQVPRAAPKLGLTQGAGPIDLGHREYGAGKVRKTVRVKLDGGRSDPITMKDFTVRLADGVAPGTTIPDILHAPGECGAGSYEIDGEGQYCNITIDWDPRDDERLEGVIVANVEVWMSPRAIEQAETLADRPGGWEPFTWEWEVIGVAAPAPPPAVVTLVPGDMEWSARVNETGETVVEIHVENRTVKIDGIHSDPWDAEIEILAGREGACEGDLEPGRKCPVRVRWEPKDVKTEEIVTTGEIVATWRERDIRGKLGRLQTSSSKWQATQIAEKRVPEATLRIDPSELVWSGVEEGTTPPDQEFEIEVTEEVAQIFSVRRNLAAERSKVRIVSQDGCERVYQPGIQSLRDWCRVRIGLEGTEPIEEGAAVVIVWAHGNRAEKGDRLERLVKIRLDVKETEADAPARLAATPSPLDFGDVGPEGRTLRLTLRNTGGTESEATIEKLTALGDDDQPMARVSAGLSDCGGITLAADDFCDAAVRWVPIGAGTLSGKVEIIWRRDGARARDEVAITGRSVTPEVEPTPQVDPAAYAGLKARRDFLARRALPALEDGHVDVGIRRRDREVKEARRRSASRIIDRDLTGSGEGWLESGRPIDLNPVVLSNTPIPAVLLNRCNAVYDCVVQAMVERDVWGSGAGRAVVIPRGAKVMGQVQGIGAGGGDVKVSGKNARVQVRWDRIVLPDGTAFGIVGIDTDTGTGALLATGNIMGGAGLPAVVDPYEMELFISRVGRAGLQALTILYGPDVTYKEVQVPDGGGEGGTTAVQQRQPTKQELAAMEIQEGLKNVSEIMQTFQDPLPSIIVPAGTRMKLYPLRTLKLTPIQLGPDPAGEAGQDEIDESLEGMRLATRRPQTPAEIAGEQTQGGEGAAGGIGSGQHTPADPEDPIFLGMRPDAEGAEGQVPEWAQDTPPVGPPDSGPGQPLYPDAEPMPMPPGGGIPEGLPPPPGGGGQGGNDDWLGDMGG